MTPLDARIRLVAGFALWIVAAGTFLGLVPGWLAVAAFAFSVVLILTAAARFCPIYALAGIRPKRDADERLEQL